VHSFGVILYEVVTQSFSLFFVIKCLSFKLCNVFLVSYVKLTEGVSLFHPKPPEEVAESICIEGKRPTIRTKSKSYPPELKE